MTISRFTLDISYDTGLSALLDEFDPFPEWATPVLEERIRQATLPEIRSTALRALSPAQARRARAKRTALRRRYNRGAHDVREASSILNRVD